LYTIMGSLYTKGIVGGVLAQSAAAAPRTAASSVGAQAGIGHSCAWGNFDYKRLPRYAPTGWPQKAA
jgi:hypothetical protein